MSAPTVAVVMSTFDEERYVDRCLDALAAQTVPCEVVVVDGGSRDATVARLRARASNWPALTVLADGKRRSLPDALNVAIAMTDRPLVAKVDARTFVAPDFLERALAVFEREGRGVTCVGGRPEQHGETPFGEGFARARMSPFGVGASGYADERAYADVDSVQCGIYRRDDLLAAGGFDPRLQYGEDEELNWRLRRAGLRIVRDTSIRFTYLARPSWRAAFRQYRNYGRARVEVWRKHPQFLRAHHLAPSAALAGGTALLLAGLFSRRARIAAGVAVATYGIGALAAAARASRGDARIAPYAAAAFPALHVGYGLGMLEGLVRAARS